MLKFKCTAELAINDKKDGFFMNFIIHMAYFTCMTCLNPSKMQSIIVLIVYQRVASHSVISTDENYK